MERISVLLSDSSCIGCQLLRQGIEEQSEQFDIVQCTTSVKEALSAVEQSPPHLILLNTNLEDGPGSGFRVLNEVRRELLPSRVIILFDKPERETVLAAFRGGARGIFSHDQDIGMLCRCMQRVHEGQIWAESKHLECLLEAFATTGRTRIVGNSDRLLTQREEQVAQLVVEGLSNRDISRKLHLSEHTVKNYLFRIFDKLGISSRVDLAMYMVHKHTGPA